MTIIGSFPYKQVKDKGIFYYLRQSDNLQTNIVVKNSSLLDKYNPLAPFGLGTEYSWHSQDIENSWLSVYFPNFKVKVTSYTMKSHHYSFPTSWSLEARNSKHSKWVNVSFVKDRTTLASDYFEYAACNTSNFYSMYRIRMYGKRTNYDAYHFEICLLEFFGLIGTNSICTTLRKKSLTLRIFYMTFILVP